MRLTRACARIAELRAVLDAALVACKRNLAAAAKGTCAHRDLAGRAGARRNARSVQKVLGVAAADTDLGCADKSASHLAAEAVVRVGGRRRPSACALHRGKLLDGSALVRGCTDGGEHGQRMSSWCYNMSHESHAHPTLQVSVARHFPSTKKRPSSHAKHFVSLMLSATAHERQPNPTTSLGHSHPSVTLQRKPGMRHAPVCARIEEECQ
jgi:hypothetical protein